MSELERWLERFDLGAIAPLLVENEIDLDVLPDLDESDLEKLGLSMGRRKRLLRAIATLEAPESMPRVHGSGVTRTGIEASERPAEEGERRQLTVMFCDLVGSTAMSARLDPEDLREILRRYRDACNDVVGRFDGYVARFSGDGILVYFGYPRAHEYDAERAIRASLQIVDAVGRVETDPGIELQVRIGIATGLVVVGDIIGMEQREEQAVVGETPNLAARLQALAEPNEIVISPSTRALAGASFRYASKGRHLLKGLPEPVDVWVVEGSSDVETRFEAIHGASTSPLVDRDGELDWLRTCWSKVATGHGQAVMISGEAGFGKSRLVHAFSREIRPGACHRLRLQCSPYHVNSALFPISSALTRAAEIATSDSDEAKREKVARLAAEWSDDPDAAALPIARLLSIAGWQTEDSAHRSPERLKEDTFAALLSLVRGRSAELPLLILFEDVHWIDPTSWEFLERLGERVSELRVLLVVTLRPDSRRRLSRREHITRIELARLDTDSVSTLVTALLDGKTLPDEVHRQILAKTDGVPLFVEELTKMVLESDLLRESGERYELTGSLPELAIPATLQDSLMARLDRLEPVKEVAQVGAVLGREFDYELLEQVITNVSSSDLDASLGKLADAELLFASGRPPRAVYTFKHALVQDAAYSSILHSKRRALHARVADVIEKQFPERAFLEPELVARHCEHGGLNERAVGYWRAAGERALERSAITEALAHVEKGRALLARLPTPSPRAELELETLRGWASIAAHGYTAPQTGEAFARARTLFDAAGDSAHLFPVLQGQWLYHLLQAQVGTASDIAIEMLEAAEQRDDAPSLVIAHRVQGTTAFWLGRFEAARNHLERALELHASSPQRPTDVTGMFDVRVVGLDFLSLTLLPLGAPDAALEHAERALTEARVSGALVTLAVVLQHGCLLHQLAGNRDRVRERARQLLELARREGYPFWRAHGRFFEEWASIEGPDRDAVDRLARSREAVIATGARLFFPYYSALLAELCAKAQELERAQELLELALTSIQATQERWFEAEVRRMRGEMRARVSSPDLDAAAADLRKAMSVASDQGASLWELRAGTSLAEVLHRMGDSAQARRILEPVCRAYGARAGSGDIERARSVLDALA